VVSLGWSIFAAFLLTATSLLLLIANDWRLSIGALALQYVGTFILVGQEWPVVMALTRLIAGWMAGAVLGMALVSLPRASEARRDMEAPGASKITGRLQAWLGLAPGPVFYLLSALLVGLTAFSQLPRIQDWIPTISLAQAWGSLILIGLGILKLGFSTRPLHATLGQLSMFSGFEILYAAITDAPLIAGLSAAVNLGLALVGAYLLLAPYMEPNE
jgi:hypothetical protein